jgi:hypothetical protein
MRIAVPAPRPDRAERAPVRHDPPDVAGLSERLETRKGAAEADATSTPRRGARDAPVRAFEERKKFGRR